MTAYASFEITLQLAQFSMGKVKLRVDLLVEWGVFVRPCTGHLLNATRSLQRACKFLNRFNCNTFNNRRLDVSC